MGRTFASNHTLDPLTGEHYGSFFSHVCFMDENGLSFFLRVIVIGVVVSYAGLLYASHWISCSSVGIPIFSYLY